MFIKKIKQVIRSYNDYKFFKNLDYSFKKIVIYSENSSYTHFYQLLIDELIKKKIRFTIICSDENDKILEINNNLFKSFFIENNFLRTIFFKSLQCENLIMTMPDLENYYIKKSNKTKNYIYFFHTIVSTYTIYNSNAFDNYDHIFCAGKHHFQELSKRFNGLKTVTPNLHKVGYSKIDELVINSKFTKINEIKKILIAPTWGPNNIINTCLNELIKNLSKNYLITFRPHPISLVNDKKIISSLIANYKNNKNFKISSSNNNLEDYLNNDIIISDWSGAALEFSISLFRPCIFIDTKQKINNKKILQNKKAKADSFENWIRFKLGRVIKINQINNINKTVNEIQNNMNFFTENIKDVRKNYIYNIGKSNKKALEIILNFK